MKPVLEERTDAEECAAGVQPVVQAGSGAADAGGRECERAGKRVGDRALRLEAMAGSVSAGGVTALRGKGRPPGMKVVAPRPKGPPGDVAAARERIAELERKIGQQQVDLDFFRQA